MYRKRRSLALVAAAGGGLALVGAGIGLLAAPAGAHVSPDKDEVPNEAYENVTLSVGHGCEESPTTELTVQIPEDLSNISPQVKAGWEVTKVEEELDEPLEGPHGEEITERVTEVVYSAEEGNELPDGYRDTFTIGFRTTFTEPGDYLFFKTIQACEEGENAWIEEYVEGVTEGEEPEEPSPVVLVTEAVEEGADPAEPEAEAEATDGEAAEGELAAADESGSSDDDDSSTGLAIAGIVVGVLGLAAGGTALWRTKGASQSA
jgi:uncharacterized protein YcnI